MSNINKMITAAGASDPATFHKAFEAEVQSRIGVAVESQRAVVIGKMFGLSESKDDEDCDCDDDDKNKDNDEEDDEDVAESILAMSDEELTEALSDFSDEDLDNLTENLAAKVAAPFKNAVNKVQAWRGQRRTNKRMKHARSFRKPRTPGAVA